MDKVGYPRGLIRYASHTAIETGDKRILTPRVMGYSAVLLALLGVIIFLFLARNDVEATVLRAPGTLYQMQDEQKVRNLFTIRVVNKTRSALNLSVALLDSDGTLTIVGGDGITVEANALAESAFFIDLPIEGLRGMKHQLTLGLYSDGRLLETVKTTFMGPSL
jgi:polyferredoxin